MPGVGRCRRLIFLQDQIPPGPVGSEEHRGEGNGEPGENADVKDDGVGEVEKQHASERHDPGSPPHQERHDEQVEEQSAVVHEHHDWLLAEEGADQRIIHAFVQPASKRLPGQPVCIELGDAAVEIDDAHLEAQNPQAPRGDGIRSLAEAELSVQRHGPVRRDDRHQEAHQAHEIKVIQVARLLEQEDIAEGDEKKSCGNPVEQPEGDEQGENPQPQEMPVHSVAGPGRDPVKPEVAKMEIRRDPVFMNPALLEIPRDFPQHDQPEKNPDHYQRSDIDRFGKLFTQMPHNFPGAHSAFLNKAPGISCAAS